MEKKIKIDIPDYLTLEQYSKMSQYKGDSKFGKLVHTVASLSGYPFNEVRQWPIETLTEIANDFANIADAKNEFHSIIEWNGKLYGYASIKKSTLGEYIDLEEFSKDVENNITKIAAILYRPIKKHRFDSLSFQVKQNVRMLNNDVANVFDYYEVEEYDSDTLLDRAKEFKGFPTHLFLGALSFFLTAVNLYSNATAYSMGAMTERETAKKEKEILRSLSESIGAGGGLFTTSVKPIYWRLQENAPSLN